MVFDSPYYAFWVGTPTNIQNNTFVVPEPINHTQFRRAVTNGELTGQACLVVNGKGLGQFIRITDNQDGTITLERPWTVPLDQTSVVSIQSYKTKAVLVGNRTADNSGAFQIYSQGYGMIFDDNQSERTGGLFGIGWDFWSKQRNVRRYSDCFFNQWLNNRVSQGFLYDQSGNVNALVGTYVRAQELDKPIKPPHAVMALGNIVRGNQVQNQTTLGAVFSPPLAANKKLALSYVGRDLLFEDNQVSDAGIGIQIDRYFLDCLVRHNHFEGCKTNVVNEGIKTLVTE